MRAASRIAAPAAAIPIALALTVFAFACGSASEGRVLEVGSKARWVMLFVVLGLAAWECRRRRSWPALAPFALAGWFVALAFLSAAWSVDPRLTLERAFSLAVLFTAALLLTSAVPAERILAGLLGGAVMVALAGLVVLAVDHRAAVQRGTTGVPPRFRGLGESANTSALLFGVALPLTLWLVLRNTSVRVRLGATLAFLLLAGSIVAAGSRGALVGGFAGSLVTAVTAAERWRVRGAAAVALVALFVVSFGIGGIPKPLSHNPRQRQTQPKSHPAPGYLDANESFPLTDDIGRPLPDSGEAFVPRQEFGSSGRTQAWRGALHQVDQRPTVGYGFGTEGNVFINRFHLFAGGVPENSYIGLLLQIGAIGLASFLLLIGAWLARGARALSRLHGASRLTLAATGGVVAAALVSAFVQSYVVSVGDIATLTFWFAAFTMTAATGQALR